MTWIRAKNVYLGAGYLPRSINNLISLKISCNETPSAVWLLFPSRLRQMHSYFLNRRPAASRRRRRRLFERARTSLILFARFLRLFPVTLPWLMTKRHHWKTTAWITFHALLRAYIYDSACGTTIKYNDTISVQLFLNVRQDIFLYKRNLWKANIWLKIFA